MAQELKFRALESRRPSVLPWVLAAVVAAGVIGAVVWGLTRTSSSQELAQQLAAALGQAEEYRKALAERDKLLSAAHEEGDLLRSPGQAMGIFYRAAPEATESGVVIASPAQHAARLYLYGLVAPPSAGEYQALARGVDGSRKPLGRIVSDDLGDGFLLVRDVPPATSAVELALRPAGRDSIQDGDVRISARYPTRADERGVLIQQGVEARRGRGR